MILPLVPQPSSVHLADAAPVPLTPAAAVLGEPGAARLARDLLAARTGATPAAAASADGGTLRLTVDGAGAPESYRLVADADGVVVTGADAAGLAHGVQTLGQLLTPAGTVPAVRIEDAPRFPYRAVMLDVARHFHPVDTVLAVIDRAAGLKFNHLHLHLTDDQGWRLALRSHPELAERGSGSSVGGDPGGAYTAADHQRILAHAASRHITVVPEIDLPGHTHAIGLSHPEVCEPPVLSAEVREVTQRFGGTLPRPGEPYQGLAVGFSSLRLADERTWALLSDVLTEVAAITPGPYLHIGGDEALGTPPEEYRAFLERLTALVAATGKIPMAWHEAGAAPGLAPGTVGQYWGFVEPTDGMDALARAFVDRGGKLVLSPADAVYLDMKPTADSPLGLTWANGPTSLERAWDWDPAAVIPGVAEASLLGVCAPLWTETVRDLAAIDALVFPRIAAAAEAAWSTAPHGTGARTWPSFRARVAGVVPLWRALGYGVGD